MGTGKRPASASKQTPFEGPRREPPHGRAEQDSDGPHSVEALGIGFPPVPTHRPADSSGPGAGMPGARAPGMGRRKALTRLRSSPHVPDGMPLRTPQGPWRVPACPLASERTGAAPAMSPRILLRQSAQAGPRDPAEYPGKRGPLGFTGGPPLRPSAPSACAVRRGELRGRPPAGSAGRCPPPGRPPGSC